MTEPEITAFARISSAVGDAYLTGVEVESICWAFLNCGDEYELEASLDILVKLYDLCEDHYLYK